MRNFNYLPLTKLIALESVKEITVCLLLTRNNFNLKVHLLKSFMKLILQNKTFFLSYEYILRLIIKFFIIIDYKQKYQILSTFRKKGIFTINSNGKLHAEAMQYLK